MTHIDYITKHLLPTWLRTCIYNFKVWADLMTDNYEVYANPYGESAERECYEWFWASINMDETYSKEYLEYLSQMVEDIDNGLVKTYPMEDILKLWEEDMEKYYDKPAEDYIREWREYFNKDS